MVEEKRRIVSFRDLQVYQRTYKGGIIVMTEVVPKLPDSERYDLKDQLARSAKAIPRLIAEGYAKRHQKHGFTKYLDDAMAECNETIVSLSQCRDIYSRQLNIGLCDTLVAEYDVSGRQLYRLREAWFGFGVKGKG